MTTIYLIRHGEIERFSPRRFIGITDPPLTPDGRLQVVRLARFLKDEKIDSYHCSPLLRCRESCQILLEDSPDSSPHLVTDLREISLGAWEGLTVDEVRQHYPGEYEKRGLDMALFRPAGGESFRDLQQRAWTAFDRIARSGGGRIAIIAHAGVNRTLICTILGMPLENLFRIEQDFGCLNRILFTNDRYRLKSMNLTVSR